MSYSLAFHQDSIRVVSVTATIRSATQFKRMQMDPYGIPDHIEGGWAKFITMKWVEGQQGQRAKLDWDNQGRTWEIESGTNYLRFHYDVALNHDEYDWSLAGGEDARPAVLEKDLLLWISKALFIFPQAHQDATVDVTFELPPNWQASTPWQQNTTENNYTMSLESARNNVFMVGRHLVRKLQHDSMTLRMAIVPELGAHADLLAGTMQRVLPVFKDIFGELPNLRYLICASTNPFADGEAFRSSFHQMFTPEELGYTQIVWANILAHEMFHLWNGTNFLIAANVDDSYWFSEGFTEYYANLALVRSGVISPDEFLKKFSFHFSRYFTASFLTDKARVSLREAGKLKFKNWGLIYGGGAVVAFAIDVKIRHVTKGEKSLDDFMKLLYQRFGKRQIRYDLEDLSRLLTEITGERYSEFFDQYIYDTEFLPLRNLFKMAGLQVSQYMGEFFLQPDSTDPESNIIMQVMGAETK